MKRKNLFGDQARKKNEALRKERAKQYRADKAAREKQERLDKQYAEYLKNRGFVSSEVKRINEREAEKRGGELLQKAQTTQRGKNVLAKFKENREKELERKSMEELAQREIVGILDDAAYERKEQRSKNVSDAFKLNVQRKKEQRTEQERVAKEQRAEQERVEKEQRAEQERVEKEQRAEQERVAKEQRAEQERVEKEQRAEQERVEKEQRAEEEQRALVIWNKEQSEKKQNETPDTNEPRYSPVFNQYRKRVVSKRKKTLLQRIKEVSRDILFLRTN